MFSKTAISAACHGVHLGLVAGFLTIAPPVMLAAENPAEGVDNSKIPAADSRRIDFVRDVQPILATNCFKCHGSENQKNGLRLDLKPAALRGGDSGPILLAGKGAESPLIQRVAGVGPLKPMPPVGKGDRLTAGQIGILRAWIDQGAAWPDEQASPRKRSEHWSLQPLSEPLVPPASASAGRAGNAVDHFVGNRLAAAGLHAGPEADKQTLIRRLSFDLRGVPPSPEEIDAFLRDDSSLAWERLVERMLSSPLYGERWGRHWLDVVRYTESQGFEYDKLRDNAWHYRDYVIRSLNEDKPYNRFMAEQIAGDVLEPVNSDGIIATSLLVCGPWDEAGNAQANATQRAITREDEMEDLLGVVGQSFLGLTLNCARCHSHKFDPIPQDEYYRLRSVFDGVKHGERSIAAPSEVEARNQRIAGLRNQLNTDQETASRLESLGYKRALASRPDRLREAGPAPHLAWSFIGSSPSGPGELLGGATLRSDRLQLDKSGAFFRSAPISRDISEKTLEAWISLGTLDQGGGAAISIETEDGRNFDAIVFGERQKRKWTAGSDGFQRTRDLDAPEETTSHGAVIHMAVVYRADNSISVFRNGEPYGKTYKPSSALQTFKAGKSRILLGMRHTGGGKPFLNGEIIRAALHDRALSPAEVAQSFRSSGFSIPQNEVLAALTAAESKEHQKALNAIAARRRELDSLKPLPVSYVGNRVQPSPARRLRRGDVKSPEEIVSPAAVSAIVDLDADLGLAPESPEAQRRIRFAKWLSDPRNPLPARVIANRIWQFHFGQGIVGTPNDFGASGARPTHPELLDWLASRLIQNNWSLKSLHRLILLSATYRQSSEFNPTAAAVDADNQLLWRFPPRRLESEAVRDAMLVASGQINWQSGGPSFRPFEIQKFPANAYVPVDRDGSEFNRRTVYRMNVNSGKEPLLDAFDCPDPSVKTPRRGVTTTPLQALALMNNSFVQRQAARLSERAMSDARQDVTQAIQRAYRLALGRPPSADELEAARAVVRERSLVNVCWALLNSTEFVYVR